MNKFNTAILETSGLVSVIKKARYDQADKDELLDDFEQNHPSYLFIEEGDISKRDLEAAGKTKDWLLEQLRDQNIEVKDIYFAEWHQITVSTFKRMTTNRY